MQWWWSNFAVLKDNFQFVFEKFKTQPLGQNMYASLRWTHRPPLFKNIIKYGNVCPFLSNWLLIHGMPYSCYYFGREIIEFVSDAESVVYS